MSVTANLESRIEAVEAEAASGCGLSDVLYESRVQDAYEELLESAPEDEKPLIEKIIRERGYDPDQEPYEPAEDECRTTGINVDCCPCGLHP